MDGEYAASTIWTWFRRRNILEPPRFAHWRLGGAIPSSGAYKRQNFLFGDTVLFLNFRNAAAFADRVFW